MEIATSPESVKEILSKASAPVGFVPTMGALHEGHLSLIKRSLAENATTVVSIFVNPTQFLPGEDLNRYPKKLDADRRICELAGVDLLFVPKAEDIYFDEDEIKIKAPPLKGYILEGYHRPGHFDGVLWVVNKLFNIVSPDRAYFGKKDAQQLFLVKKMVRDLFMDIEIVECDIVREPDGLAMSSRNVYLDPVQRERALLISKSLKRAAKMIMGGVYEAVSIKNEMRRVMEGLEIEYIEIVDRNFDKIDEVKKGDTIILVAAKVGDTRLIDNLWV